jgi:hypothetical protein
MVDLKIAIAAIILKYIQHPLSNFTNLAKRSGVYICGGLRLE